MNVNYDVESDEELEE